MKVILCRFGMTKCYIAKVPYLVECAGAILIYRLTIPQPNQRLSRNKVLATSHLIVCCKNALVHHQKEWLRKK